MKVGFVVNQIDTEQASYTTTRLAMTAVNRGHEAWLIGTGDLALDPDDYVRARARAAPKAKYKSLDTYLEELRGPDGRSERITVDDLDVLMLRNDPAEDLGKRQWAQMAGILFGRASLRRGVIVLNDPYDGGMHLPDIFIFKPLFAEGRVIAYAATICHHTDVGGRVPGSNASDSTEIYAEGLRIPPLKLYERGSFLARYCLEKLDGVELKVTQILARGDGTYTTRPISSRRRRRRSERRCSRSWTTPPAGR